MAAKFPVCQKTASTSAASTQQTIATFPPRVPDFGTLLNPEAVNLALSRLRARRPHATGRQQAVLSPSQARQGDHVSPVRDLLAFERQQVPGGSARSMQYPAGHGAEFAAVFGNPQAKKL